jgi:translation initiation factor 3 subunit A
MGILLHVDASLRELFNVVEHQFHPLDLCKNVFPSLAALSKNEHFAQYVKPLQDIVALRFLKQVSFVFNLYFEYLRQ